MVMLEDSTTKSAHSNRNSFYPDIANQIKMMKFSSLWWDEETQGEAHPMHPYYRAFGSVVVITHLVTMSLAIDTYWGDLQNLSIVISLILSYVEVSFKVADMYLYRGKIEAIVSKIRKEFYGIGLLIKDFQSDVIDKAGKDAIMFCKLYVGFGGFGCLFWCVEPFVDRAIHELTKSGEEYEWPLPFLAWYPLDTYEKPGYVAAYLFQVTAVVMAGLITLSMDSLLVSIMIISAAYLRLLGDVVENIRKVNPCGSENAINPSSDTNSLREDNIDVENYRVLVQCIKYHKALASLVKELDDVIGPIMLFQFLATSMEICLAGFQVKVGTVMGITFFKFMIYTGFNIIQTFCYCKYGDDIIQESWKFSNSIYNSEWYEQSASFKKTLRLLLLQSQKPLTLWAGKFYEVSLDTFSKLMHHSYSFFTLLTQIEE